LCKEWAEGERYRGLTDFERFKVDLRSKVESDVLHEMGY
jgi:hypothetical protein